MADRCPYCSFDPTSDSDFCSTHRNAAPAAHQETPEPTELDRQVAEYKAKADRGEAVSASDLRWLLNELIHERDQRGTR